MTDGLGTRTRTAGEPPRENFPVALVVLPRTLRHRLWAIYRYARYVDDLGDEAAGDRRPLLSAVAESVRDLYAGRAVDDRVVAALAGTVRACAIPQEPLLDLIRANLVDQEVTRYATFEELLGYCRLSADPVGVLVLHVFGAVNPARLTLSGRVCTGLQLLEHWQDVAADYRVGRVYLPQQDLARFGVREAELAGPIAGPDLRALLSFETDRALAYLEAGAPLVSSLHGWARLAVSGYVAGGRAAANRLRAVAYDPLSGPPTPARRHILAAWLGAIVRYPG